MPKSFEAQITAIYLAPDIIPQGKIAARYSLDFGIKKAVQKGKGELFLNVTDILNTLVMPISRVFPLNSLIRLRDCFK